MQETVKVQFCVMLPDIQKKRYIFKVLDSLPSCLSDKSIFKMTVKQLWNDIDVGKPKYSEKSLSLCHFVHRKSHMHRPGIETGPLPEPRDGHCRLNFT